MGNNRKGFPGAAVALLSIALGVLINVQPVSAQGGKWHSVRGQAVVASVQSGGTSQVMSGDTLPTIGGMTQSDLAGVSVPGFVTADVSSVVAAGAADSSGVASSQSIATASNVSVLNGLITASKVISIASTVAGNKVTAADGDGSSISDLVIGGQAYGSGDVQPAPNTRVDLPGVGYAILNEQIQAKGGAVGITVNMIHVVLQGSRTGDVIVGSATSSAGR